MCHVISLRLGQVKGERTAPRDMIMPRHVTRDVTRDAMPQGIEPRDLLRYL